MCMSDGSKGAGLESKDENMGIITAHVIQLKNICDTRIIEMQLKM